MSAAHGSLSVMRGERRASNLNNDPLVRLVLQDTVCWIRLDLLSDGRSDSRDEGQWVEVQVVTEDLSEHLGRHQLL